MSQLDQVNLFRGWPSTDLLPTERLKKAAVDALSNPLVSAEGYGYGPDEGYLPLRKNIAWWLSDFYAPVQPVDFNRICITGGASQNLACILQVFTDPIQTKHVWLADPTYHLVFQTFEDAGFYQRLGGIPEDEEGLDVNALAVALEAFEKKFSESKKDNGHENIKSAKPHRKSYRHVIYCVPTFSNPSNKTMSLSRRESLVTIARKYDALIICDDVYDFLQYPEFNNSLVRSRLPRLVDIDRFLDNGPRDRFGNVVSNGSFSKLIGAGCRVGWAEGTGDLIYGLSQTGSTRSGGAPSQLMSTFINELFEDKSLQRHIVDTIIPAGARRYALIISAINEHLAPLGVTFLSGFEHNLAIGGYYVWIRLSLPFDAAEVCKVALDYYNLVLGDKSLFTVPSSTTPQKDRQQHIRLCFMWEAEDKLAEGVKRLGSVLRMLRDK
ncbi:aminotransferase-like domain-containing protein [Aspergillus chevalieri]|uniref:Aminotransferase class I/classII large domain-containing protein n=1 Tax=Aspergillus chevalieri TaxID=182096 RepID=A0A7R7VJY2_ASPCH|nr:uncharacterized protein ACHE_21467A [Aspergillus chevalieri]BCR86009.1 hypothetical protein ACHE_21467A [Aspergillus chevalieri]